MICIPTCDLYCSKFDIKIWLTVSIYCMHYLICVLTCSALWTLRTSCSSCTFISLRTFIAFYTLRTLWSLRTSCSFIPFITSCSSNTYSCCRWSRVVSIGNHRSRPNIFTVLPSRISRAPRSAGHGCCWRWFVILFYNRFNAFTGCTSPSSISFITFGSGCSLRSCNADSILIWWIRSVTSSIRCYRTAPHILSINPCRRCRRPWSTGQWSCRSWEIILHVNKRHIILRCRCPVCGHIAFF